VNTRISAVQHSRLCFSDSTPVALYVTDELVLEFYDGGHASRRFSIRWDRLVPAKEREPKAAPQSSPFQCPPSRTRLTRTSTYRHCMRNEDGHENSCDH
jgi:hypothetical protein